MTPNLLEPRTDREPPNAWQAIWKEKGRSYRLWMLSSADRVTAAYGPGQQNWDQLGRLVRYVDVVNVGENLRSQFVAIHEPSGRRGHMPVRSVQRLNVPGSAGPDAVALRIVTRWGDYLVFNGFTRETEIEGVRFKGDFGVLCRTDDGAAWLFAHGAETLKTKGCGFRHEADRWCATAESNDTARIRSDAPRPKPWRAVPPGCQNYVRIDNGKLHTGYPLAATGPGALRVDRFPLETVKRFELPALRYMNIDAPDWLNGDTLTRPASGCGSLRNR